MARLRVQYGGSFDPVHEGHLAVARCARDRLQAEIWFMPAADPPHKPPTVADAGQRLAMLGRALAGQRGLHVDPRELCRAGPSYTIDTLIELRAEIGAEAPLAILIGADSFLGLPRWRRWRELPDFAHIVIAERPGSRIDLPRLPEELRAFAAGRWSQRAAELQMRPHGRLLPLRLPLRPESSSALRARIAAGGPWRAWTPPAVAEYIVGHGLYGARPDPGPACALESSPIPPETAA